MDTRGAGGKSDVGAVVHDDARSRPAYPYHRLPDQGQEAAVRQAGLADLHQIDAPVRTGANDSQHPFDGDSSVTGVPAEDPAIGDQADRRSRQRRWMESLGTLGHQGRAIVSKSDNGLKVRR